MMMPRVGEGRGRGKMKGEKCRRGRERRGYEKRRKKKKRRGAERI